MLRFEVRTTSPILISEIFFNSAISQISSPIHRKIPSTSSGTILTLNLKFTSLINCTSAEDFEVEIKAQEKAEKKEEQERVDTSVYGKIGKKKATEEIKKLTPLFAKYQSDDKKTRDQALKDAQQINKWAEKHNLTIVQDRYYKLFERKKSA